MKNNDQNLKNNNNIIFHKKYEDLLKREKLFYLEDVFAYQGGETFRKNKLRDVLMIKLTDNNREVIVHLKRHKINILNVIKSLFSFSPLEDAANEWNMMLALNEIGVDNMPPVSFGSELGIISRSFTITEHLYNTIRLEEYIDKANYTSFREKCLILDKLAEMISIFHKKGYFHNDLYLGHFFYRPNDRKIFMIDLQRVQRRRIFTFWKRLKDMSQLMYSAIVNKGVNRSDCLYFYKSYCGKHKLNSYERFFMKLICLKAYKIDKRMERIYKSGGQQK